MRFAFIATEKAAFPVRLLFAADIGFPSHRGFERPSGRAFD